MRTRAAIGLILLTCLSLYPFFTARAADDRVLYEGDSIYHHITIRQGDGTRCMVFGRQRDLRQTCIELAKPDASVFEYTAMMFAGYLFRPDAGKVCLIGLGGGYIPTVFRMHLPTVRLQTVEVDPHVERLARKFFAFTVSAGQALVIDDGRHYLKKNPDRYDQIWLDAFNSDYVPAHMTTKEFLQLAKSRLNEGGIVIQNLFCDNRLYDAQIATFHAVFRRVFVFEGRKSKSCIIVASDRPACEPEELRKQARKWGGKIGRIDLIDESGKCIVPRIPNNAPVLTDDFNPANLLLMQKKH